MFDLLDVLVEKWLAYRYDKRVEQYNRENSLDFHKINATSGGIEAELAGNGVAILAEEASRLLDAAHAKNYVVFEMFPRLNRKIRPIRVTVQWMYKLSPHQKAQKTIGFLESLRRKNKSEGLWSAENEREYLKFIRSF